ncbi:streptomycin biosynthesis enzyme StrG [Enhygromyxa salina]|uniref:Uncharacterized protein n=1 Tax=Enhygromyxa salina TaxID=215803 RepID=A0A2S9YUI9_9BACT|nr:streptomycin biosynthesis enzyme StrG [Enhygromyxa salina]PRQ08775.1 hypothetical protein ENSA7_14070 [Enhygromyxa salina]
MASIRDIEGWDGAMSSAKLIRYEPAQFPFEKVFCRMFRMRDVSRLHRAVLAKKRTRLGPEAELGYRDSKAMRDWMASQAADSAFYPIYHAFVRLVLAPFFGGKLSYPQRPRFRVHLARGPGVSDWHRDTDITGRFDQIAAWIPMVDCRGTRSMWVESDYGKADHRPVEVRHGEVLVFDSGLSHGTVANESDVTRVGFDLRFAPLPAGAGVDRGILARRPEGFEADRVVVNCRC